MQYRYNAPTSKCHANMYNPNVRIYVNPYKFTQNSRHYAYMHTFYTKLHKKYPQFMTAVSYHELS